MSQESVSHSHPPQWYTIKCVVVHCHHSDVVGGVVYVIYILYRLQVTVPFIYNTFTHVHTVKTYQLMLFLSLVPIKLKTPH